MGTKPGSIDTPKSPRDFKQAMLEFPVLAKMVHLPLDMYNEITATAEAKAFYLKNSRKKKHSLKSPKWAEEYNYEGVKAEELTEILSGEYMLTAKDVKIWTEFLFYLTNPVSSLLEWDTPLGATSEFFKNPTSKTLDLMPNWVWLIPNILEIVENGEFLRKLYLATAACAPHRPRVILNSEAGLKHGDVDRLLDVWIHLTHCSEGSHFKELDDIHFWGFEAFFAWAEPAPEENPLLAVMNGYFISPQKGDNFVNDHDFFWTMDAESSEFNTIAKFVMGEVIPAMGFDDLFEFSSKKINQNGMLVPFPEIHKDWRKKGMLAPLLDILSLVLAAAPINVVLDTFVDREIFDQEMYHNQNLPSPWFGRTYIIIFQVIGTAPEDGAKSDMDLAIGILAGKLDTKPKKVDLKIETKRLKLTRYYKSLEIKGMHVAVYNPWDYPIVARPS